MCHLVGDDEDGSVLIIRTYLDETGVHDGAPVTAVAAYFSDAQRWKIFTRRWLGALKDFGLIDFHMNDYAQRQKAFKGWGAGRQRALGEKLFPLIPTYTRFGLSVAMVRADFEEVFKDYPNIRKGLGHPYACCFQWLISLVIDRLKTKVGMAAPGWRLGCIHEDNDFKKEAVEAWDWVKAERDLAARLGTLAFAPKSRCVPLQAADVLAWESQKLLADPHRPERKSLTALKKGDRLSVQVMDKGWLRENAPRLDALAAEHLRVQNER